MSGWTQTSAAATILAGIISHVTQSPGIFFGSLLVTTTFLMLELGGVI